MIPTVFFLIAFGILLGKIPFGQCRFGLSGVLGMALLFGVAATRVPFLYDAFDPDLCSLLSSLGTALFVSAIGAQAGDVLLAFRGRRAWKALAGGVCTVLIGVGVATVCFWADGAMSREMLLGLFAGGMTSTPALSAALELSDHAAATLGYAIAYVGGVLSIILFAQRIDVSVVSSHGDKNVGMTESGGLTKFADPLLVLAVAIGLGFLLGKCLPIGHTGGILFMAMLLGMLCHRNGYTLPSLHNVKHLGLALFFVGSGLSAGQRLALGVSFRYLFYGALISLGAVLVGYRMLRSVLRLSPMESAAILCGGMTSTPAIALLQERREDVPLSLYSLSYVGALVTLLLSVRVMWYIL